MTRYERGVALLERFRASSTDAQQKITTFVGEIEVEESREANSVHETCRKGTLVERYHAA